MEEYMLTTVDNPYNPFTQFDEWYSFDASKGYHTPEYLARIAIVSDELSEEDYKIAINDAINEILENNLLGIYIKVTENNFNEMISKPMTKENEACLALINQEE